MFQVVNSSAALVQSQMVCLLGLTVGILNLLSLFQLFVSLALESPSGEWSFKYVCKVNVQNQRNSSTVINIIAIAVGSHIAEVVLDYSGHYIDPNK